MDCLPVQSFLIGGDLMPSKQVRADESAAPRPGLEPGTCGLTVEVLLLTCCFTARPYYTRLRV